MAVSARNLRWPWIAIGISLAVSFTMAMASPADDVQGDLVRIMYVHVPSAWLAYTAFFVTFIGSLVYLVTRNLKADRVAAASAEIGVFFTGLALALGMIWAKPTWGVWWTWDARLTSTLLLWLIYASYLFLRTYMADDPRMRRSAAVLGILGALNVPIVYYSVKWFNTQHPTTFITQREKLHPDMAFALWFAVAAIGLLAVGIFLKRRLIGRLEEVRDSLLSAFEEGEMR